MYFYNPIIQFVDYLRYREAVRKADQAHAANGERYYVMPTANRSRTATDKPVLSLIVMDRANFRKLKQKHYVTHRASVRDLVSECFYCTAYRDGNGYLDAIGRKMKLALYFSYCRSQRAIAAESRRQRRQRAIRRYIAPFRRLLLPIYKRFRSSSTDTKSPSTDQNVAHVKEIAIF